MYKARRRTEPPAPTNPADFAAYMEDTEAEFAKHYKATVTYGDESASIFMSSKIRDRMGEFKFCFYDATFYCTPRIFYQTFSVLGITRGHCFPLVHVLMTGKCEGLYQEVTEKIKELAPTFAPEILMGDFEQSSHNAMQNSFPGAQMGGCQFHFSQAIWKKCQKLGLTDTYKTNAQFKVLIKRLMSIPYIPANLMEATATELFLVDLNVDNHTRLQIMKLRTYFFCFWIRQITPARLSVHQFIHGTNNFAESLHARIKAIIRSHRPPIWSFCAHITNIISDCEREVERLDNGLNLTRQRKKAYMLNMQRRAECKEKFLAGTYNAQQYLTAIAHTMDSNLLLLETSVTAGIGLGTNDDEAVEEGHQTPPPAPAPLQCMVCLGPRERTIILRPCNHAMLCPPCSERLTGENARCPYCRTVVQERFEVFLG